MDTVSVIAFLFLAILRGGTPLVADYADEYFSPVIQNSIRGLFGSILLAITCVVFSSLTSGLSKEDLSGKGKGYTWMEKQSHIPAGGWFWSKVIILGIFSGQLPTTLISLSDEFIPSGLGSVLMSMTPIVTFIAKHLLSNWIERKKKERAKWLDETTFEESVAQPLMRDPTFASSGNLLGTASFLRRSGALRRSGSIQQRSGVLRSSSRAPRSPPSSQTDVPLLLDINNHGVENGGGDGGFSDEPNERPAPVVVPSPGADQPNALVMCLGLLMGLAGALAVCVPQMLNDSHNLIDIIKGICMVLLSAISWTITSIYNEVYMFEYAPMPKAAASAFTGSIYGFIMTGGTIGVLPHRFWASWDSSMGWCWLVIFAVMVTYLGGFFYYLLLDTIGPTQTQTIWFLVPAVGLILGAGIKGDDNSYSSWEIGLQIAGVLVIWIGLSLTMLNKLKAFLPCYR